MEKETRRLRQANSTAGWDTGPDGAQGSGSDRVLRAERAAGGALCADGAADAGSDRLPRATRVNAEIERHVDAVDAAMRAAEADMEADAAWCKNKALRDAALDALDKVVSTLSSQSLCLTCQPASRTESPTETPSTPWHCLPLCTFASRTFFRP
jgi:hypothetical protein